MNKRNLFAPLFALLLSCTPAQSQVVIKTIDDELKCITANIDKTPEQIALVCGVSTTPDLVNLVTTFQAAKRQAKCTSVIVQVDAGAKGPGL